MSADAIRASAFEALFVRALAAEGSFRRELCEAGVDLDHLHPEYPQEVWLRALKIAQAHVHPGRPEEEALRELGRSFAEGFLQTVLGGVVRLTLPLLGLERVIDRSARYIGLAGGSAEISVRGEGPRCRRVCFRDPAPLPDFMAGVFEGGLVHAGTPLTVGVQNRAPGGFDLLVSW